MSPVSSRPLWLGSERPELGHGTELTRASAGRKLFTPKLCLACCRLLLSANEGVTLDGRQVGGTR